MRPEGANVVHFDVRQVDADGPEDAAPLGRGQHGGQVLQVPETDQELQREHRATLQVVAPYGELYFGS